MNGDLFSASSSALGYAYQFRLALSLSISRMRENLEHLVSVELLDDVAFVETNGTQTLVQAKHHEQSSPLTDLSPDIWKTLRVWATNVANGSIDTSSTLLLLVTTGSVAEGSAASNLLANRRDPATALAVLETAMASSQSTVLATSFDAFRSLTTTQREDLLDSIVVLPGQPDAVSIREQIEKQLEFAVPKGKVPPMVDRLEGWWFDQVVRLMSKTTTVKMLPLFAIDRKLDELREQFRSDNLPIDFQSLVPDDDQHSEFLGMTFVEQMRLVGANHQIVDAIKDYYRAFTQRNRWVSDSLLYIDDLENYEERLKEAWRAQYHWMMDELGETAAEGEMQKRGRELLKWVLDVPECYIKPECTEPYVVRGNLHILANDLHIGWHPEFESRLSHLLEEALSS